MLIASFGFKLSKTQFLDERLNFFKVKLKIKVNETPNQPDFFTSPDIGQIPQFGEIKSLEGEWVGDYNLDPESIFWINPNLEKSKIVSSIKFGQYKIYFKFDYIESQKLTNLRIAQELIKYDFVNIEIVDKKQINYWAKALSNNWLEVVRGKIFTKRSGELITIYQTTVYEGGIPIYAFKGESLLSRP